jgi:hypothetical protein
MTRHRSDAGIRKRAPVGKSCMGTMITLWHLSFPATCIIFVYDTFTWELPSYRAVSDTSDVNCPCNIG